MPNSFFQFKQFTIHQERSAMKVTTDACLFGAWVAGKVERLKLKAEKGQTNNLNEFFLNVLDIGSGTALLSLMLAQKKTAAIDAIEIDEEAYQQAIENVSASPWKNNISLLHGDARIYPFPKKYDTIISNPPFYEKEIKSADHKKNIAHHGHALRLNELLPVIRQNLSSEGRFYLLLPFKRNNEIEKDIAGNSLYINEKVLVRQSVTHGYFRIMLSGSFIQTEVITKEISIRDESQQYTNEFIALLRDYYLYL
jgi:tRNA1Val (adenine37-N6)-methyltransferase